jgi:LysR family glycine cleavage system transcriptional activator
MRTYIPLNALRAFESAARHLSFTKAAQELCVSPTAVSHHVRSLEEFLEAPLFERSNGKLTLTPAAAAALAELSEGFNRLECAMMPLNRRSGRRKISVAASPSVASLWLLPKLQRFFAAAPGLDVSLSTVIAPSDYRDGGYDIAICNFKDHPNRKVDHLMDERILPVCAPSMLRGDLDADAALKQLPLIHDDKQYESYPTWARYLEEQQVRGRDPSAGLRFNQSSLAMEAAVDGHGMLLGRSRLMMRHLARKALAPVSEQLQSMPWHYYTVCQPGSVAKPIQLFLEWLRGEVDAENAVMSAFGSPRTAAATPAR